jgi:hypothetical protein
VAPIASLTSTQTRRRWSIPSPERSPTSGDGAAKFLRLRTLLAKAWVCPVPEDRHQRRLSPQHRAKSFSLYATIPESDSGFVPSGIYDQNRQAWFYGRNDDVWTEHKLPNTIPGAMALEDIITKADVALQIHARAN